MRLVARYAWIPVLASIGLATAAVSPAFAVEAQQGALNVGDVIEPIITAQVWRRPGEISSVSLSF